MSVTFVGYIHTLSCSALARLVYVCDTFFSRSSSSGDARKESFHSNGSVSDNLHSPEGSPVTSPRRGKLGVIKQ